MHDSLKGFDPHGTIDNKLWPDRLTGTKALDLNCCRQPIL